MTQKYSVKIGVWKSIKNVLITVGIPAVLLLLDNYTQWVPNEYNAVSFPVISLVAYFVKNYLQNR